MSTDESPFRCEYKLTIFSRSEKLVGSTAIGYFWTRGEICTLAEPVARQCPAMSPAGLVCAAICALGWAACWPADEVVFPRPKPRNRSCCSQLSVPVSLARQLSLVSTPEQFLSQYVVDGESLVGGPARVPDFAVRSSFADAPKSPPLAVCKPELRTLSLRDTDDPTVVYYPACVRLEQCGGCCNHQLLECQAKNVSKVNVTIQIAKYTGANRLQYQGEFSIIFINFWIYHQ